MERKVSISAGLKRLAATLAVCAFSGCAILPGPSSYPSPEKRPDRLIEYYSYDRERPYTGFEERTIQRAERYTFKELRVKTEFGPITVDYYQRPGSSPNLIFVFPILGGKHVIEGYFARHFANNGFDAAIVHRDKDFKDPSQFDQIESIFRKNVIRDRIAIDMFEREYGKKEFGTFGISRGGINVAMTAGVDGRLKHNVIAFGASHLVEVFRKTSERGVKKYRKRVQEARGLTEDEFYEYLEKTVHTDPKYVAKYLDPAHTLMFLSLLDSSVPTKYGLKLRREIGDPRTMLLLSGHYTGVLFTQFVKLIPPSETFCIFPFDVIESESLEFYHRSFQTKRRDFRHYPFILLKTPLEVLGKLLELFF